MRQTHPAFPRRLLLAVAGLIVVSGCVGTAADPAPATGADPSVSSSTAAVSASTTAPLGEFGISGVCAEGAFPFTADGVLDIDAGEIQVASDAAQITDIEWESSEQCDRIKLSFETTEGAPAVTPPPVAGTFLRGPGLVRLELGPTVASTTWSFHAIETPLTKAAYVVTRLEGVLSVDIHLAAPAFVRVDTNFLPAEIVIDLIPGGEPYTAPPVIQEGAVIVSPTGGSLRYPLTVDGYLRNGGGTVTGVVEGTGNETARSTSALATDELAWESFVMVFPTGPTGTLVFTLGEGIAQTTFTVE